MKTKIVWFGTVDEIIFSIRKAKNIREAWKKTLNKWDLLANGHTVDDHSTSCGLCDLYLNGDCVGCPVKKVTKLVFCKDTPYRSYNRGTPMIGDSDTESARIQINFLKAVKKATEKNIKRNR